MDNDFLREKRDAWRRENVPAAIGSEPHSLFFFRPRPRDIWIIKRPGKSKLRKWVDDVELMQVRTPSGIKWRMYVNWQRANKGRYTGITVRDLLRFGKLEARMLKGK